MEHTPTPWKTNAFRQDNIDHPATAVWTDDGLTPVCITRFDGKQNSPSVRQAHINALHIATCVNQHDALVSRVEELEAALRGLCNISDEGLNNGASEWAWQRARALLARKVTS